jgi:hypothetical protein
MGKAAAASWRRGKAFGRPSGGRQLAMEAAVATGKHIRGCPMRRERRNLNLSFDYYVGNPNPNQGWEIYLYRVVGFKPITQIQPMHYNRRSIIALTIIIRCWLSFIL